MDHPAASDSDHEAALTALAAALAAAVAGAAAESRREALDILAVAAGLKPVAVVGYGGSDPARETAITAAVAPLGFAVLRCQAWLSCGELVAVPPWFAETIAAGRGRTALLAVSALPDRLRPLRGEGALALAPLTETSMLGYPSCCTAFHAAWRAAVHRQTAREIIAAADGSEPRARRMAAAGWTPMSGPGSALAALLDRQTAPDTAIVMCPDCHAGSASPARRISSAYARLAARLGGAHGPDGAERDAGPAAPPGHAGTGRGSLRTASP